jgi:hypothetical protein
VSQLRQRDDDQADEHASIGVPGDSGWTMWTSGRCSITQCPERPTAAIERAHRPRRPAHWQPYCASHARERGVEGVDGTLVWTAEFLSPPSRDRATRRHSGPRTPDEVPAHPARPDEFGPLG